MSCEVADVAKLIGSARSENYGENLFISRISEYLDDTHIIYWNREIFGKEFDVCILLPNKGIIVVELKGWREENIIRIDNSDRIVIKTDEGEVFARPQKQARGYRFAIERRIRQNTGKFPLVISMVCLPQVSSDFFHMHRLDVILENEFTILKEDLEDNKAFFKKLDLALLLTKDWMRMSFDTKAMLEVRNLFETDIELDCYEDNNEILKDDTQPIYHGEYSQFYYISKNAVNSPQMIAQMAVQYGEGCKLYAVFGEREQLTQAVQAIDEVLANHGLIRNRDNLEISFESGASHFPPLCENADSFATFNCSFSVLSSHVDGLPETFNISSGKLKDEQPVWLEMLSQNSQFNADQYLIEHANSEKNIIIRAGAGTGKTYTMISRIGYICYDQNIPVQNMADRIVMITFTNEAADQMEEKLKAYFRNCYLISSRVEYLTMISRIDNMQISTIHSYAKHLIAQLGTEFGYGTELGITSSQYFRRRRVSEMLDKYINQKILEQGQAYLNSLGIPIYALRESILDFIGKLHNKNMDVASIRAENFGSIAQDGSRKELHTLLATIIPAVERAYSQELLEENRIHLSAMMSVLNRFINNPESEKRIKELQKGRPQFMFVDEFQDTDDTQIETMLVLARILEYRLFLVGDIKQCIYRFRGAKEKAFDQLHIEDNRDEWLQFSLQRNYRTDSMLLDLFDRSFTAWGARSDELLSYCRNDDRLIGTRNYNGYIAAHKDKFYKYLPINNDDMRIPTLIEEIRRIQKRLEHDAKLGFNLSAKEKSIAILVRENWQANLIRAECGKIGINVQTSTGGDLYMSPPATDMMILVNAMLHFDEANYLYNLVISNFFDLEVPKSTLYEMRLRISKDGWRAQSDEKEQTNYLIKLMNLLLSNTATQYNTWELIIRSIRTKPILQVIRDIYSTLKPWQNFSNDPWKQHYYQLNVDLLFEQLINACNTDRLTISSLQECLHNSIVSKQSVDSRTPSTDSTDVPIQCITVHKAKGLEYGHIILPFCSAPIDYIKKSQLHISAEKLDGQIKVGYSLNLKDSGLSVQNDYYDEAIERAEKSREETRILYVAMTRAIRSFSWIELRGKSNLSWQALIDKEAKDYAI